MINNNLEEENEEKLVKKLKRYCYLNGREKNILKTSKIFHKLGLIYGKKGLEGSDKLALIQSTALLNAAAVRNPDNLEIKKDIATVCKQALAKAKAIQPDADLVLIAEVVKKRFNAMRKHLNDVTKLKTTKSENEQNDIELKHENKIKFIKTLQENIARDYVVIMSDLAKTCSKILGEITVANTGVKFALIGMGSLARREITPYSDFESFILLQNGFEESTSEYSQVVEYFRWFAVIFQIVLINLGETVLPSVAIPSLNDFSKVNGDWFYDAYTTCGVSFDGMMPWACKTPLGRQSFTNKKKFKLELIQPVSKMLHYLHSDEDLKNGYHLAEMLTKTCFVYGSEDLHKDFLKGVNETLNQQKKKRQSVLEFSKQIQKDLISFDMIKSLNSIWWQKSKFNLKRVLYRSTTIFLAIIAKFYGIEKVSSFDIIEELMKKSHITYAEKLKLEFAIAVACEVRLKAYMLKKRQDDWLVHSQANKGTKSKLLIDIIGEQSIVEYCETACQLQDYCRKIVFLEASPVCLKFYLGTDVILRAEICCALRLHKMCIKLCENELKKEVHIFDKESTKQRLLNLVGVSYMKLNESEKALAYFQQRLQSLKNKPSNDGTDIEIAKCCMNIGSCLQSMKKYDEALEQFEEGLEIQRRASEGNLLENDISLYNHQKNNLSQHISKTVDFEQELNLHKQISVDEDIDIQIANSIGNIGICMANMNLFENAMEQFQQESEIRRRLTSESSNLGLANCYRNMALCMKKSKNNLGAIKYLKEELNVRSDFRKTEDNDISCAQCLELLTVCLIHVYSYEEALSYGHTLLCLRQALSNNESMDILVADSLHLQALCYVNIKQETKAIEMFEKELEIRKRISNNKFRDPHVMHCRKLLGMALLAADRIHEGMRMLRGKRKSAI